jgi:hypothetical protein
MRLRDLANVAVIFVIAGIALGIGAEILYKVNTDVTAGSIANQSIGNASEGIQELASWMPTMGLVIAAGLIIAIIFASFGGRV